MKIIKYIILVAAMANVDTGHAYEIEKTIKGADTQINVVREAKKRGRVFYVKKKAPKKWVAKVVEKDGEITTITIKIK